MHKRAITSPPAHHTGCLACPRPDAATLPRCHASMQAMCRPHHVRAHLPCVLPVEVLPLMQVGQQVREAGRCKHGQAGEREGHEVGVRRGHTQAGRCKHMRCGGRERGQKAGHAQGHRDALDTQKSRGQQDGSRVTKSP